MRRAIGMILYVVAVLGFFAFHIWAGVQILQTNGTVIGVIALVGTPISTAIMFGVFLFSSYWWVALIALVGIGTAYYTGEALVGD